MNDLEFEALLSDTNWNGGLGISDEMLACLNYQQLEQIISDYNWDDGFGFPTKILSHPLCDLALALQIFYLGDGFSLLAEPAIANNSRLPDWALFVKTLYQSILDNAYTKTARHFQPSLTKVQIYQFRKRQIPDIFLDEF